MMKHTSRLILYYAASCFSGIACGQENREGHPVELPVVEIIAAQRETGHAEPSSISTLDANLVERERIYQVQDMPNYLTGLNANFFHARESAMAIRGIGNNAANEGLQGSAGLYVDNVYLGRPGLLAIDLFDIEQVDLIRGPQGTLFGKNTTAGVLRFSTHRPVFERQAQLEVSAGNRGYRQFKAMLNSPLSEHTAIRLTAYGTHDDGWLKNRLNNAWENEINRKGIRLQMLNQPDSETSIRSILEHHEEDSSTGTLVPYAYGPWNRGTSAGNLPAGMAGSNATTYGARAHLLGSSAPATADPYRYDVYLDGAQRARTRQNAVSIELNRKMSGHQLTAITAWRDWHFSPDNDMDNTSLFSVNGGTKTTQQQFSQELRLAASGSSFDYILGSYYLHQTIHGYSKFNSGPYGFAINSIPNNATLSGRGKMNLDSFALFGQGTAHVNDRFDITAGLRVNHETQSASVTQEAVVPAFPVSPLFKYYDSGLMRSTEDSISTQLGARYRLNSNAMLYANYAQSEKSGGYNLNGVLSPGALMGTGSLHLKPEKARSIEIGLKSNWLSRKLTFNLAAFQTEVTDYQAITNTDWQNTYISYLANVGDIIAQGIETESRWQAGDKLDLRFNIAYLDARFKNGNAPTPAETFNGPGGTSTSGYGQGIRSLAGKQVNGAPHWMISLGGHTQWRIPEHDLVQYLDASYAWRSATYGDINNSAYSRLPAYGLFNIATGWRGRSGHNGWDFSVWIKNVFDKRYYLALIAAQNAYFGSAGQPRTVGASLKFFF